MDRARKKRTLCEKRSWYILSVYGRLSVKLHLSTRERQNRDTHLQRKNAALTDKIVVAVQRRILFHMSKSPKIHVRKLATLLRDPNFIAGFTPTCSSTHVILAQTHLQDPRNASMCVWRACRGARALSMLPVCGKTRRSNISK